MNTHEFCNWFQGVLDMAETDKEVKFTPEQLSKIRERLNEALRPKLGPITAYPSQGDKQVRC